MHGGPTPRGPLAGSYKNGRYSKVFPCDMRKAYARVRNNPNLLCLEDDVAVLETKQQAVLAKMDEVDTPPWGEAVEAFNDFALAKTEEAKRVKLERLGQIVRSGAGAAANLERLWSEFRELSQEKAALVKHERDWLAKLRSVYTAEQALAVGHSIMAALTDEFGDQPERLGRCLDRVLQLFDEPKLVEELSDGNGS
jgi:hypothetical protein